MFHPFATKLVCGWGTLRVPDNKPGALTKRKIEYTLPMNERWEKRFVRIRLLGWFALAGIPFAVAALFTADHAQDCCIVAALILILPAFIYAYVLVIFHWKDRYRGKQSDLWGAIILLETSGWMKIVYFCRHIVPDMYHKNRYQVESADPS